MKQFLEECQRILPFFWMLKIEYGILREMRRRKSLWQTSEILSFVRLNAKIPCFSRTFSSTPPQGEERRENDKEKYMYWRKTKSILALLGVLMTPIALYKTWKSNDLSRQLAELNEPSQVSMNLPKKREKEVSNDLDDAHLLIFLHLLPLLKPHIFRLFHAWDTKGPKPFVLGSPTKGLKPCLIVWTKAATNFLYNGLSMN